MSSPLHLPSGINSSSGSPVSLRLPPINKGLLPENGLWDFPEKMFPKGAIGFIYAIRDKTDGRMYIGKKQFAGLGKLNKGIESDWKTYTSSQKVISEHCRELRLAGLSPALRFDFICLEQYSTKGGFSFAEVWTLVTAEIPSNRTIFYNSLINGISWPVRERVTDRHKSRFSAFIQGHI